MSELPSFDLDSSFKTVSTSLLPTRFKEDFGIIVDKVPNQALIKEINKSHRETHFTSLKDWDFALVTKRQNGYLRVEVDLSKNAKNNNPINRYQLLVEAANDIIFEIDTKGIFSYMNPTALRLSGYPEEEIVGHHFTKLIRDDWKERSVKFYRDQVVNSIKSTYFEFPVYNANQEEIWIGQKVQLLENESGIEGLMAVGRDITDKKETEDALKQSEEKYRGIIQNLNVGLLEVGLDETIHYANSVMTDIMGYTNEELLSMKAISLITDKDSLDTLDAEHEKRKDGQGSVYEVQLTHKDGHPLWALISGAPIFDQDGKRVGSIGMHLDITDQKNAQKELEFTQNRLNKYKQGLELINEITSNTTLSIREQLSEGLATAAAYLELPIGIISSIKGDEYTVEEFFMKEDTGVLQRGLTFDFKKTYCEIVFDQETYVAINHFSESEYLGHPCYEMFRLETYIGAPYYVNGQKRGTVNFYDADPRNPHFDSYDTEFISLLARWIGSLITQIETENALQAEQIALKERNEELFKQRNFLRAVNDFVSKLLDKEDLEELAWEIAENVIHTFGYEDCVVYLLDPDGKYMDQVAAYGPKMGGHRQIINPIQIQVGEGIVGAVAKTGLPELVADTSKDERYIVDAHPGLSELSVPIIADGEVIGVIDSEHTEADFYKQEDLDTLLTVANIAANRLKIARAKHLQRQAEEKLFDSERKLRTVIESAIDGVITIDSKGIVTEWNRQCEVMFGFSKEEAIGKPLTETIIPKVHRKAHERGMKHYLKTGEGPVLGQKIEINAVRKDGSEFPVELAIVPVIMKGEHSFTAFISDITIQKAVQAETEKALLKERELNELKSRFVAMTSHEFRTPLTTIKQNIDLVSFKLENDNSQNIGDYSKHINRIESEINRVTALMNDILTLGRIESGKIEIDKQTIDFHAYCERIVERNGKDRPDERSLEFKVTGVPRGVQIDEQLFDHILTNLISNAFKYSEGKANPQFTLDYSQLERVKLVVRDFGIGIPETDQKGLFQSFYRATNVKNIQGSGLGLSIVKEFVEMHGGVISVDSKKDKGSTFTIEIPYN